MAIWRQKRGGEGTKLKIKLFTRSIKTSNVISCVGVWVERNSFRTWRLNGSFNILQIKDLRRPWE